jgi:hypothetical protein
MSEVLGLIFTATIMIFGFFIGWFLMDFIRWVWSFRHKKQRREGE